MSALLSFDRAADTLGISVRLLKRLVSQGDIAVVKIGKRTLFRPEDLSTFVQQRVCKGGAK